MMREIFHYPVRKTWEFVGDHPIRSVFPLWPVYGLPMQLLQWLWVGNGHDGEITPIAVLWTLRVLMFVTSLVLEDFAIYELMKQDSTQHQNRAWLLVASSYVTWTYQTHTFSNSIETLVVCWCMVLISRIKRDPHISKPGSLAALVFSGLATAFLAIALDTAFYTPRAITWLDLFRNPIITPLNNLRYNMNPENLAHHGLHPWYQHLFGNLPILIGPAVLLIFTRARMSLRHSFRLYSALSGIIMLSFFKHQEARFLLPVVPLILSSIQLPENKKIWRYWVASWVIFNSIFGILMGTYHQGGIIPAQVFMSQQPDATHAVWWKTYMPPIWLLNGKNEVLTTEDVMSLPGTELLSRITEIATCDTPADRRNNEYRKEKTGSYLVAPASATWIDPFLPNKGLDGLRFREVWRYSKHLNLDDLDFAEDGVWNTLRRVVGRRGLVIWRVTKSC
ncbi:alpha 1,2 mannosyltransferase [Ceratocystis pirilliformis]|uniref:Mannosyltransferase n=1 Tax=Ceratocystis pirilliformis TaxID=259994 RepID=A0ABR3YS17_9PEZI